jgi:hypothetical protein
MAQLNQIKATLDSDSGKALKDYLLLKLAELRDISNIKPIAAPTAFSVEAKAQEKAYQKLKEILGDVMTFGAEVKEKDPRDSYEVT